jgi:hypothetical protein
MRMSIAPNGSQRRHDLICEVPLDVGLGDGLDFVWDPGALADVLNAGSCDDESDRCAGSDVLAAREHSVTDSDVQYHCVFVRVECL